MANRVSVLSVLIIGAVAVGFANADEGQSVAGLNKYMADQQKRIESYYERRIAQLKRSADRQIKEVEQAENDKLYEQAMIERERRINYWGFANPDTLISPEQQDAMKNQIEDGKNAIELKLATSIENLEKRKVADLKRLVDRKKQSQAPRAPKAKQTRGIVSGIVYSTDAPMILLDNQIRGEGEIKDGVKIIKIYPRKVEFEKNGDHWVQRVREPADSRW